jgi:hypothetical protein
LSPVERERLFSEAAGEDPTRVQYALFVLFASLVLSLLVVFCGPLYLADWLGFVDLDAPLANGSVLLWALAKMLPILILLFAVALLMTFIGWVWVLRRFGIVRDAAVEAILQGVNFGLHGIGPTPPAPRVSLLRASKERRAHLIATAAFLTGIGCTVLALFPAARIVHAFIAFRRKLIPVLVVFPVFYLFRLFLMENP